MDRKLLIGIGIGMAAGVLGRAFYPALKEVGRPLAKATIKSGLTAVDKAQESIAHFGELVEDMVAEVRAERAQETAQRGAASMPDLTPPRVV
jgi:hypothetical protein